MTDDGNERTDRQEGQAEDPESTMTHIINVTAIITENAMLRRKLAICHDLSKHVWEDNTKRNFRLLKQINGLTTSDKLP